MVPIWGGGHRYVTGRACNPAIWPLCVAASNPPMLQKTDKARQELSPGVRTLSLRERSLLLMAGPSNRYRPCTTAWARRLCKS